MSVSQERIKAVKAMLLKCTGLRKLFHPVKDYRCYSDMVNASIEWALDNWQVEAHALRIPEWTFEESVIVEICGYQMCDVMGQDCDDLDEIRNNLLMQVA